MMFHFVIMSFPRSFMPLSLPVFSQFKIPTSKCSFAFSIARAWNLATPLIGQMECPDTQLEM